MELVAAAVGRVGDVADDVIEVRTAAGAALRMPAVRAPPAAGSAVGAFGTGSFCAVRLPPAHCVGDVRGGFAAHLLARPDLEAVRSRGGDGAGIAGDDELALAARRSRDLDPSFLHRDHSAAAIDGDREHRAFHQRDEVRRADPEMRCLLLLDPEHRAAIILEHLDDAARIARLREAKPGGGRDDHIILPAHEHGARSGGGLDHVPRAQDRAAAHGGNAAAVADIDPSRRFGDAPGRFRGGSGRSAEEHGEGKEARAYGHGRASSSACTRSGARPIMPDGALTKAQRPWLSGR